MATLMAALFGCETVDKRAIDAILTQLFDKYGRSFTVYALGDRIGKDTATAYVFADDDPTLLFTARVNTDGKLVYENYAYRTLCRNVEDIANATFGEYGMTTECIATFLSPNINIEFGMSLVDYVETNSPDHVVITMIMKSDSRISGENIVQTYQELYDRLFAMDISMGLYVLSANDYDKIHDSIRRETQVFDAYHLTVHGVTDAFQEANIQVSESGMSMSAQELENILSEEGS